MAVPVIRDVSTVGIGPPALVPIVAVGHLGHAGQESLFGIGIRQTVRPPHDHRSRADHALGHPTLFVLVQPRSDLVREAELAVRVIARAPLLVRGKLPLLGQEFRLRTSEKTSSAWPFPCKGAFG